MDRIVMPSLKVDPFTIFLYRQKLTNLASKNKITDFFPLFFVFNKTTYWSDIFLLSISSTFYVQIFRTNVILAAFSSYVLALSKNSYEKHVCLTLMKLTATVIGNLRHSFGSNSANNFWQRTRRKERTNQIKLTNLAISFF